MNFFISRAGEDRDVAVWIAAVLRSEGHTTTLQDDDFRPGQSFVDQMQLAMDAANHFIVLISPHYLAKPLPLKELYSAVAEDPLGRSVSSSPCGLPPVRSPA